jgi:endoglycosylceramidase
VERFADHPAVIGYDVMNEPVFANGNLDETLAVAGEAAQGKFENPNLNDFMQTAIDGVRGADDDAWIFIEPTSLLNAFPYPGDLRGLADPRKEGPRLVYAGHLYETAVHDGAGYDPSSPYIADWQRMRSAEAKELKAALWPGEWGGTADQNGFDRYVSDVTDMLDEEMAGWSYWSWDPGGWGPLDDEGKPSANGRLLMRVQPRAIAGEPTEFSWDPETLTFTLEWNSRDGVQGTTDVAVPLDLYPDGFEVSSTDEDGSWSHELDDTHNVVRITASDAPTHRITISPA